MKPLTRFQDHPALCRGLIECLWRAEDTGLFATEFGRVEVHLKVNACGVASFEFRLAEGTYRATFSHQHFPPLEIGPGTYNQFEHGLKTMLGYMKWRRKKALEAAGASPMEPERSDPPGALAALRECGDEPSVMSREEEIRTLRALCQSRPATDPLHQWARRRLVQAGLLDTDQSSTI